MYRNSFRLTSTEIDEAFATRQFRLVFQPKIDLTTSRMVGVESFARWQHPEFGVIPPALFLPVLAQQGRNQELTRFVLAEAISLLNGFPQGDDGFTVSVNVAPDELADGSLPVSIRLALTSADLDPSRLVIDLPERGLATAPDRARDTIHALRQIGVGLAIECAPEPHLDFAAGDPPFDVAAFRELKIGGQAIIQFASRLEGTGLGLLNKRIAFARDHGMTTTAVGAETAESLGTLQRLGFAQVQGNAISQPLMPQDLAHFDAETAMAGLVNSTQERPKKQSPATPPPESLAAQPSAPRAKVQVVRGKASVELMTQGNEETATRIYRLSIPKPDNTVPGRQDAEDAEPRSFMSRLQRSLARSLNL